MDRSFPRRGRLSLLRVRDAVAARRSIRRSDLAPTGFAGPNAEAMLDHPQRRLCLRDLRAEHDGGQNRHHDQTQHEQPQQ